MSLNAGRKAGTFIAFMKVAAAILFWVLLVAVQTPAGQFFKLPFLVCHYMKHQLTNGVSVIDFLEDHYATGDQYANLPEDEQLPFKSIVLFNIGFAILPDAIRQNTSAFFLVRKKMIPSVLYNPQQHLNNIFHPPRPPVILFSLKKFFNFQLKNS